jgi:hypothetical protein
VQARAAVAASVMVQEGDREVVAVAVLLADPSAAQLAPRAEAPQLASLAIQGVAQPVAVMAVAPGAAQAAVAAVQAAAVALEVVVALAAVAVLLAPSTRHRPANPMQRFMLRRKFLPDMALTVSLHAALWMRAKRRNTQVLLVIRLFEAAFFNWGFGYPSCS